MCIQFILFVTTFEELRNIVKHMHLELLSFCSLSWSMEDISACRCFFFPSVPCLFALRLSLQLHLISREYRILYPDFFSVDGNIAAFPSHRQDYFEYSFSDSESFPLFILKMLPVFLQSLLSVRILCRLDIFSI